MDTPDMFFLAARFSRALCVEESTAEDWRSRFARFRKDLPGPELKRRTRSPGDGQIAWAQDCCGSWSGFGNNLLRHRQLGARSSSLGAK